MTVPNLFCLSLLSHFSRTSAEHGLGSPADPAWYQYDPNPTVPACTDKAGPTQCQRYAAQDYCVSEWYSLWMQSECTKTCGLCPVPAGEIECSDLWLPHECTSLSISGKCATDSRTRRGCEKSCGLCVALEYTSPSFPPFSALSSASPLYDFSAYPSVSSNLPGVSSYPRATPSSAQTNLQSGQSVAQQRALAQGSAWPNSPSSNDRLYSGGMNGPDTLYNKGFTYTPGSTTWQSANGGSNEWQNFPNADTQSNLEYSRGKVWTTHNRPYGQPIGDRSIIPQDWAGSLEVVPVLAAAPSSFFPTGTTQFG